GGASGSLNVGQQKIDSDYASVTEQSGIKAGDGGFDIRVEGNTDLKGAVIASNQSAIDAGLNTLDTGTLTHADIVNHAEYDASSLSLGFGYSSATGVGASTPVALKAGDDDSSTTQSGVSGGGFDRPRRGGAGGAGGSQARREQRAGRQQRAEADLRPAGNRDGVRDHPGI